MNDKKMCRKTKSQGKPEDAAKAETPSPATAVAKDEDRTSDKPEEENSIRHRGKRESYAAYLEATGRTQTVEFVRKKPKKQSKAKQKHGADGTSGGMEALLPSVIGLAVFGCAIMAKMGFRGRAEVAGIDLGTTNSVICVQQPSKGVGIIECIDRKSTRLNSSHLA